MEFNEDFKPFEVDVPHLMEDIKEHYSIPIEDAVIVENVDNCIDENYNEIHFNISGDILEILMIGDGINKKTFEEILPKIAASTKYRDKEKYALGRYGWGMKVIIYVSEYVLIETKLGNYRAAQQWKMEKGYPKYRFVRPSKNLDKNFTSIKMVLKKEFLRIITPEHIAQVLQDFYPTVLNGAPVRNKHGKKRKLKFFINSKLVEPPLEFEFEKREDIIATVSGEKVTGKVFFTKQKLPEEKTGIAIIVHGRKIKREFFSVYGSKNDRITGYIHADVLIKDLAGDKTNIKKTSRWRDLAKKVASQLSQFMKEIGAIKEEEIPKKSMKHIHEEINKLIKDFPELIEISTKPTKREVLIQRKDGEIETGLTEGSEPVPGTVGGDTEGGRVPIMGGDDKTLAPSGKIGDKKAIKRERRTKRGGIEIKPYKDTEKREAWYSPGEGVVMINTEFPTYKKADKMGSASRDYHMLRCAIDALLDYARKNGIINENEFEKYKMEVLSKWGEI